MNSKKKKKENKKTKKQKQKQNKTKRYVLKKIIIIAQLSYLNLHIRLRDGLSSFLFEKLKLRTIVCNFFNIFIPLFLRIYPHYLKTCKCLLTPKCKRSSNIILEISRLNHKEQDKFKDNVIKQQFW